MVWFYLNRYLVKWKFDDGSGCFEKQTLMKKNKQLKKNGSKNIWHMKKTSSKSYLLGLWNEYICIPYNARWDICDGAFLCYLIIFSYVSSQSLFSSYSIGNV